MDNKGWSMAPRKRSKLCLFLLSTLLVVWSCDDSDVRPVSPYALCGPDTLESGSTLAIDFSYDAGTNGHFESYSWTAVGDTLRELVLLYSYSKRGCSTGAGEPGSFPDFGTAILRDVPSRTFSVKAGALRMEIPVADRVEAGDHLRITLVDDHNQRIAGVGGYLASSGDAEQVPLEPTDSSGVIFLPHACQQPGATFLVYLYSDTTLHGGEGRAHWPAPCTIPQHMLILGH